jgi:diguanylate cyclase (GGDEF)-like protein
MTTLALSENKFSSVETILELDTKKQPTNLETISNLANRISRDFEYINKNLGHLIDEKIKHIESIYHKDHLTKVNNRFQLIKDFKKTENLSLILINIDGFRSLNGFYGNSVGDFVLIELSKKFKKIIKNKPYKLYRLNADEFALLKFSKTTKKDFENFIQFINHELQDTVLNYKEVEIHIDFTIGAISQKTERPLALVDFALKQARINKKPYYIYDKSINLNEKYSENIKMANKIKKALKEDRIIPYYQAIIDNKTKKVVKYEALVRLIDGDKVISPFFFLDISKKIRLYNQITKAVVRHSFKKFSHNEFDFSINLTIDDIANKDTIDYIFEQLEVYDVKDRLIFEITETEEIKNYDILIDFIKKAQAMGIKIAIDDFGTGYSNFNYMIKLTPDIIKIDGSMIKNIEHNKDSQILTKLIVNSVKEMKMKMVAEFVENKEIFEIIKEMGIDYSQGYYFSQPKEDL